MQKFLAQQRFRGCANGSGREYCNTACQQCDDCERETRGYSECWSACDECKRCQASAIRADVYDEPYFYVLQPRTLAGTPAIAKQYCDNICGVNMCKAYRARQDGYNQCKRCEQRGQCWSQYQQRCVQCPGGRAMTGSASSCERKWGCPNPNGAEFGYVPPMDPMFSDCRPCWNPMQYTT